MVLQIGFQEFALDYFIPFILLFSIFYALLQLLKIFGDPTSELARRTNVVIALSVALLTVWVNPFGIKFSYLLAQLFTGTSLIVLALVFLIFFSTMISLAAGKVTKSWLTLAIGLGLVILLFSTTGVLDFFRAVSPGVSGVPGGLDWSIIGLLAIIFVFVGVLYWLFELPGA